MAETSQNTLPVRGGRDRAMGETASIQPFRDVTYTDTEKVELDRWQRVADDVEAGKHDDAASRTLNDHLASRTTLLGSKPSSADILLYNKLAPIVSQWNPEERTGQQGFHHIVRWTDFVQNSPIFSAHLDKAQAEVEIDPGNVIFVPKPADPKEEKERKKKEKAAAAATGDAAGHDNSTETKKSKGEKVKEKAAEIKDNVRGTVASAAAATKGDKEAKKKEKKEKQQKGGKQEAPKETKLTPALIDLRVGHILKAIPHPNADSLYVSTIACGDAPGTDNTSEHEGQVVRTVCSGLNGLVPLEEMQGRLIVAVCNLKPVTMRGVKSAAMVLAASPRPVEGQDEDPHKGPVELVSPPQDAKAGQRVCFEGFEGEPEGVLNPKKKIWESCQVGFTTTTSREVAFDSAAVPALVTAAADSGAATPVTGRLKTSSGGVCTVKTLTGATVR